MTHDDWMDLAVIGGMALLVGAFGAAMAIVIAAGGAL